MAFFQRLMNYWLNEVLVNALANRWAVWISWESRGPGTGVISGPFAPAWTGRFRAWSMHAHAGTPPAPFAAGRSRSLRSSPMPIWKTWRRRRWSTRSA